MVTEPESASRLPAVAASSKPFPPRADFSSLSLRDVLEAREAYHIQLSSLENVVATAIGRYLIRIDDWYADHPPDVPRPSGVRKPTGPRTLDNAIIRPWSWPAVLVFVRSWKSPERLGPNVVPNTLYLPDGRAVPTCVVEARPDEAPLPPAPGPSHVSATLGGGYAALRAEQGVNSVGTFACLVYKDGSYYALTNRHVAGSLGAEVQAYVGNKYVPVGVSTGIGLSKVPVAQAFPRWPITNTMLTFDAGLVRISNAGDWTAQAFGIGEIGELFDATEHTLTLDLIGIPVRAFGGASGVMEGEIGALFFRYKSAGGTDYATDLLISARRLDGARTAPLTRPGDSGTLWFYDPQSTPRTDKSLLTPDLVPDRGVRARRLRPVAMQWGGERFLLPDGTPSAFALAGFLSTVCRELDIEIARNWSTGHSEYWGKLGHFAIGWKACDHLTGNLHTLMQKNQARIGFGDDKLGKGKQFKMGSGAYVPLADVPDYVWVHSSREFEPVQHFADVDIQDIDGGPSLLQQCHNNSVACAASHWKSYFAGFAAAGVGPDSGTLPFRVWQIWKAMVDYLEAGDVARFVAAAGILAHYVGDASQPLHCSFMHHGLPPMKLHEGRKYPVRKGTAAWKAFSETPEYKIHGLYEEDMLEVDTPTVLAAVDEALNGVTIHDDSIGSGFDAAKATMELMYDAQQRLAPKKIIARDDPTLAPAARAKRLWASSPIRHATITSLAESVSLLSTMWASAWRVGQGDRLSAEELVEFSEEELSDIYRHDDDFLPSLSLDQMAASGKFEP